MEKGHARRLAVELGDQGLETRGGPETVPAQIALGRDDGVGFLFEDRQLADEMEDEAAIVGRGEAEADHRSRHSRGPLAGGPKSRGASPAWNQVTKL